jgi:hypothetical protein
MSEKEKPQKDKPQQEPKKPDPNVKPPRYHYVQEEYKPLKETGKQRDPKSRLPKVGDFDFEVRGKGKRSTKNK